MLSRRRFITIAASTVASSVVPVGSLKAAVNPPVVWNGLAMGAMASIILDHPDKRQGQRLIDRCVTEIERLEAILSLYREDSALSRLNQSGYLKNPPPELVEILLAAINLAENSDGSFDPTIQPLYRLYASHFGKADADPDGPPRTLINEALDRVDYRLIDVGGDYIHLHRSGMSLTLNGIAQGYITDKVTSLLQANGMENMLIDLGELRTSGRHPDGRSWRAGVADPRDRQNVLFTLELPDRERDLPALATSGGYGTRFDRRGEHHHLFDPRTGRSASHYASVSVLAPTALLADGLSTAMYASPPERNNRLIRQYAPARAYLLDSNGAIEMLG